MPDSWDDCIVLFVVYLLDPGQLPITQSQTIVASYTSGIKAILREDGVELCEDSLALASLLKAAKRSGDSVQKQRLPIQRGLLRIFLDKINDRFSQVMNQSYPAKLNKAVIMAGYYGLMYIGELVQAECQHAIQFSDVHITTD